jgi:hypothetical protein
MHFGRSNACGNFLGYIKNTILEALDNFAIGYLHDILLYSNTIEENEEHV